MMERRKEMTERRKEMTERGGNKMVALALLGGYLREDIIPKIEIDIVAKKLVEDGLKIIPIEIGEQKLKMKHLGVPQKEAKINELRALWEIIADSVDNEEKVKAILDKYGVESHIDDKGNLVWKVGNKEFSIAKILDILRRYTGIAWAVDDNFVVIDVDSPELFEKTGIKIEELKKITLWWKTKSKGYHFVFWVGPNNPYPAQKQLSKFGFDIKTKGQLINIPPSGVGQGGDVKVLYGKEKKEEVTTTQIPASIENPETEILRKIRELLDKVTEKKETKAEKASRASRVSTVLTTHEKFDLVKFFATEIWPLLEIYKGITGTGLKHNVSLALAGAMKNAGIGKEEAVRIIEGICQLAEDGDPKDRIRAVEDTYEKEGEITALPTLIELIKEACEVVGVEKERERDLILRIQKFFKNTGGLLRENIEILLESGRRGKNNVHRGFITIPKTDIENWGVWTAEWKEGDAVYLRDKIFTIIPKVLEIRKNLILEEVGRKEGITLNDAQKEYFCLRYDTIEFGRWVEKEAIGENIDQLIETLGDHITFPNKAKQFLILLKAEGLKLIQLGKPSFVEEKEDIPYTGIFLVRGKLLWNLPFEKEEYTEEEVREGIRQLTYLVNLQERRKRHVATIAKLAIALPFSWIRKNLLGVGYRYWMLVGEGKTGKSVTTETLIRGIWGESYSRQGDILTTPKRVGEALEQSTIPLIIHEPGEFFKSGQYAHTRDMLKNAFDHLVGRVIYSKKGVPKYTLALRTFIFTSNRAYTLTSSEKRRFGVITFPASLTISEEEQLTFESWRMYHLKKLNAVGYAIVNLLKEVYENEGEKGLKEILEKEEFEFAEWILEQLEKKYGVNIDWKYERVEEEEEKFNPEEEKVAKRVAVIKRLIGKVIKEGIKTMEVKKEIARLITENDPPLIAIIKAVTASAPETPVIFHEKKGILITREALNLLDDLEVSSLKVLKEYFETGEYTRHNGRYVVAVKPEEFIIKMEEEIDNWSERVARIFLNAGVLPPEEGEVEINVGIPKSREDKVEGEKSNGEIKPETTGKKTPKESKGRLNRKSNSADGNDIDGLPDGLLL